MIEVTIDLYIEEKPEKVFAFISDFANNPQWQDGMVSCVFTSEPPLRVGSTYDQKAQFLGRDIISSFEVIAYEPGNMVKATTTQSSFPITFTRRVQAEGEGSRVNALIEGDAKGFFRLAQPLMRWMVNRSIQKDYRKLKTLMEHG